MTENEETQLRSSGGLLPPAGGFAAPVGLSDSIPRFTADPSRERFGRGPWAKPTRRERLRWWLSARTWRVRTAARVLATGRTSEDDW